MIIIPANNDALRFRELDGRTQVYDVFRKQWVTLTPEEHVRQVLLHYLTGTLQYPAGRIAVEKQIKLGSLSRRFDIVVFDAQLQPWMLIECKEPAVPITQTTLFQLLNYHRSIPSRYWLLSNGHQNFCAHASDFNKIVWMDQLPAYDG